VDTEKKPLAGRYCRKTHCTENHDAEKPQAEKKRLQIDQYLGLRLARDA
jgi:hypothetical protein